MFFNYPDEYNVQVSYSDNLIEKNNKESEGIDTEIEVEKSLLRECDPFSEKVESKENNLEKSDCKRRESIFEEADEEYINNEIKLDI